jgi:6-pyruvoyltetrahydropterin/6-carboxytetrahydropterin synthase
LTVHLSRRYTFCASHRLHSAALTDAQNQEIYGKCNNPNGHGHNYEVEVTLRGRVDPVTGRVVDLGILDQLAEEQILAPFRHSNLNEQVPAFHTEVPTTENLATEVLLRLRTAWAQKFSPEGPSLEKVRIWETERNICELGI